MFDKQVVGEKAKNPYTAHNGSELIRHAKEGKMKIETLRDPVSWATSTPRTKQVKRATRLSQAVHRERYSSRKQRGHFDSSNEEEAEYAETDEHTNQEPSWRKRGASTLDVVV